MIDENLERMLKSTTKSVSEKNEVQEFIKPNIYKKKKRKVLSELSELFLFGEKYTSFQVRQIIRGGSGKYKNLFLDPTCSVDHLARGLVDLGYLKRNKEGTVYYKPS